MSVFDKYIEAKRIEKLFDSGELEDQISFCEEFLRKNTKGKLHQKEYPPPFHSRVDQSVADLDVSMEFDHYQQLPKQYITSSVAHLFTEKLAPFIVVDSIRLISSTYDPLYRVKGRLSLVVPQTHHTLENYEKGIF